MNVTSGTRLGPYEIVSRIGSGGMGEVWQARDTRLDRSVAIKVLPADLAQNPQFRSRFEREAKAISSLNHPNICTLHDVGHENGIDYLVMELVEGVSLDERIARGPLPVAEVLRYGSQIAVALDKAHRAGIVHRDLKPGNVMITKSGAKLLDFGLAKSDVRAVVDLEGATQHKPLTQEGTILGTFQYMAPEQLEGTEADARTDIFALGAMLYEMATGQRAFQGKTKTSLIAAIVQSEPAPISTIQPLTPPAFEHVVQKCLAKHPDDRWQSAHDIAEELKWISEAGSQAGVAAPLLARRKSRERLWWSAALALAIAAALAASLRKTPVPSITMSITPPAHAPFGALGRAVLSPDGNAIVFVAFSEKTGSSLWLRNIADAEPRPVAHTEGAVSAFWSPDGGNLGFFAEGKLKRIAVAGGPPRVLCDVTGPTGGTWNDGGVIVFAPDSNGPLYQIPASGGKPAALTHLAKGEEADRWPVFLPDGDHILFLRDASRTEDHHIKVVSLRDASVREVAQGVTNASYAEPGYLLYVRSGSLLAQPFDSKELKLSGEPQVVAEQVVEGSDNHWYEFSAAKGRLTYRSASASSQLTWLDRKGQPIETVGEPRRIGSFQIAPDHRRIAFGQLDADGRGEDLWLIDPARNVTTRLTFDPASDLGPIWSPDGSKIAFMSMRTGLGDLYVADVTNPSMARLVMTDGFPTSWSPDGHELLGENISNDIWRFSMSTGKGEPYLATRFVESGAVFSPDGRSVAYQSNESGRAEIYVEQFPSHASRRQISNAGGLLPQWRADGKALFYVARGGQLMSADMTSETTNPVLLFHLPGNAFNASPDGQRFLVDRPVDDIPHTPLTFVSNWTASLKR